MLVFVRHLAAIVLMTLCCGVFTVSSALAGPTTQPTASVRGTVKADGDVPLSEMVVYLESADGARAVSPATQPVKISQKSAQFSPKLVIISVGQTVEFLNDENRPIEHNVFSDSAAKRFDLGLYGPGVNKTETFDKPGPVFLFCSIHRYMDGVIFVAPTPLFSRVDAAGHYEIANVPPGKWTLKTWQRRRRFPEVTTAVAVDEKPVEINVELKRK